MHQPTGHFRVDIAGRFIGDEQFRPGDHRTGNGDPLLLAARQRGWTCAGAVAEADPVEHLPDRRFQVPLVDAGDAKRKRNIVEGGQMADQLEVLEHHPDPAPESRQAVARHGDDILAEQADEPPAWALRQVKQLEQ